MLSDKKKDISLTRELPKRKCKMVGKESVNETSDVRKYG